MHFGVTSQGEDMEVFSLLSSQLEVRLTNYGARLLGVVYKGTDTLHGPKTADELMADTCYCGAVCGRVANRIAGGVFELGGKTYTLATNNGPNHLHGGLCGFSDKVWSVDAATDTRVELSLLSPDGEEGYPGTVRVKAIYELEGDTLTLRMEAQTDAPTLLNLTNHAYWNLNGSGTMDDHTLQICATAYTPMVANIPTGVVMPVEGTLYDLREPALLGMRNAEGAIAGGYDDNYVLPTAPGIKNAAVLSNGAITLRVATDAPGMQVYTGDYLPLKRGGVALEAQNFPDSPHHSHFPDITLLPGDIYKRTIRWQFS
ncbi:MAG: galactose mutarotase [Akkermansiaceae bacterium]|nr:galactose mutarotase [Akkermansiaceae bacterium]